MLMFQIDPCLLIPFLAFVLALLMLLLMLDIRASSAYARVAW